MLFLKKIIFFEKVILYCEFCFYYIEPSIVEIMNYSFKAKYCYYIITKIWLLQNKAIFAYYEIIQIRLEFYNNWNIFLIVVESTALDSQLYLFGSPLRAKHLLQKYIHKRLYNGDTRNRWMLHETVRLHETDKCYTRNRQITRNSHMYYITIVIITRIRSECS